MKVLIVDDHEGFRASVRRMLEADGFAVVAEAGSGAEALLAADTWKPELVLLDVNLPDIQGFEVAERLRVNGSAPAVVLTSSHDASDLGPVLEGSHFIPKSELSGEALRRVLDEQP